MASLKDYERNAFIFTWRIENAFVMLNYIIESNALYVKELGNDPLILNIIPNDKGYISIYLYRFQCTVNIEVDCEFSLLAYDGRVLIARRKEKCIFDSDIYYHGFEKFVEKNEVWSKAEFLPKDTLTVQCRIWKTGNKMSVSQHFFLISRIAPRRALFLWNLDEFSTLHPPQNRTIPINIASCAGNILNMNLYLTKEGSSEEQIQIDIIADYNIVPVYFCSCSLSVLDKFRAVVECMRDEMTFKLNDKSNEGKSIHTLPVFLSKSKLLKQKELCLPNDTLSLLCEFFIYDGYCSHLSESTYITPESQSDKNPFPHVISNISKSDVDCSLKSDLKTMFRNRILCDIKLQTPTETFQAHKNILSARSPVFRAMFTSDMMEKIKDCVDIPDMEADTMRRLLVYVYTNKLVDNQWKNVTDLYEAADKYEIISLKDECSSALKISLYPANACAILILADVHADADLKTFVQEYILRNSKTIICSNEWENMIKNHATLAAETMHLRFLSE